MACDAESQCSQKQPDEACIMTLDIIGILQGELPTAYGPHAWLETTRGPPTG